MEVRKQKIQGALPGNPGFVQTGGLGLTASLSYLQVIGYREYPWNSVGSNTGDILITLVAHYAFERYMAVLHDDMDRWIRAHGIAVHWTIAEDGAIFSHPDTIIKRREGQNLDLVDYPIYALDVFYHPLCI